MAQSQIKADSESNEQVLDFDDPTLKAIAEVYLNEGNEAYSKEEYSSAVYFYTEGIKVNCKDKDLMAELYSNRADAYFCLGANASANLNLFEVTMNWCNQGLAIDKDSSLLLELRELAVTCADKDKSETSSETTAMDKACFGCLGVAAFTRGDFKTARDYFELRLKEAKETGNKDAEGNACLNLGNAHDSLREFNKAIEFFQRGLGIAKETGNKNLEGSTCVRLGDAYHSRHEFQEAIKFSQWGLGIARETGNKDLEGEAKMNIGVVYRFFGDIKKAMEFLEPCLSIAKEARNKTLEGDVYRNLGFAYHDLRNLENAIQYHQKNLRIAKMTGNKPSEGYANVNLGALYHYLGDREKAYDCFQQGLSIAEETGDKEVENSAYDDLGNLYRCLGDVKKAIELIKRALIFAKETGNRIEEGEICLNLGRAHYDRGDLTKAMEFSQQGLIIAKESGSKALLATASKKVGKIYESLGNFSAAEKFFKSSISLVEEMTVLLQNRDEWKISFRDQNEVYNSLCGLQVQEGKIFEALLTAERGRAQVLVDLLKFQFGIKSIQSLSEEQIGGVSNFLGHISSPTIFIAEDHPKSLNIWLLLQGQNWHFIRKEISHQLTCLTQNSYRRIGVHYGARCEDRSFGGQEDIEIETFFDGGLNETESTSAHRKCCLCDALETLNEAIIAPISHWITGDEVIIVPDGSSFLIPYAALVDQHSKYLSERLRIRLAPSLTTLGLLAECPEEHHSKSGALLVGNPWVETVRIKGCRPLPQLPDAEKEVNMIGKILNIKPLTGKDATKNQVLSKLNSISLVHIAAHGRSATGEIILSPNDASSEKPREEDFLLTMADVLNAQLRAKLFVLSCCHSGQGEIRSEGVVGIARAFLGAGARAVIATLWAIDDAATLAFMEHFYENLMTGHSASRSLNQARKQMRESKDFSAEKHWAPFTLIGDDVTLDFGQLSKA